MTSEANKDDNFSFSMNLLQDAVELANRHSVILNNIKERYSTIES